MARFLGDQAGPSPMRAYDGDRDAMARFVANREELFRTDPIINMAFHRLCRALFSFGTRLVIGKRVLDIPTDKGFRRRFQRHWEPMYPEILAQYINYGYVVWAETTADDNEVVPVIPNADAYSLTEDKSRGYTVLKVAWKDGDLSDPIFIIHSQLPMKWTRFGNGSQMDAVTDLIYMLSQQAAAHVTRTQRAADQPIYVQNILRGRVSTGGGDQLEQGPDLIEHDNEILERKIDDHDMLDRVEDMAAVDTGLVQNPGARRGKTGADSAAWWKTGERDAAVPPRSRMLILPVGGQFSNVSTVSADPAFVALRGRYIEEICAILGVPTTALGIGKPASVNATAEQSQDIFVNTQQFYWRLFQVVLSEIWFTIYGPVRPVGRTPEAAVVNAKPGNPDADASPRRPDIAEVPVEVRLGAEFVTSLAGASELYGLNVISHRTLQDLAAAAAAIPEPLIDRSLGEPAWKTEPGATNAGTSKAPRTPKRRADDDGQESSKKVKTG